MEKLVIVRKVKTQLASKVNLEDFLVRVKISKGMEVTAMRVPNDHDDVYWLRNMLVSELGGDSGIYS
jgi:hypothetical protein